MVPGRLSKWEGRIGDAEIIAGTVRHAENYLVAERDGPNIVFEPTHTSRAARCFSNHAHLSVSVWLSMVLRARHAPRREPNYIVVIPRK